MARSIKVETFTNGMIWMELPAQIVACVAGCWASRWRPRVGVCWPVSVDVVVVVGMKYGVSVRVDCE